MRMRHVVTIAMPFLLLLSAGCDLMTRFAAVETSGVLLRATRAVEQHWDVDLIGEGLPASIVQLEGLYAVMPDDEQMGIEVMRANGSYAWGWLEEQAEDALERGDLDAQEAISTRAQLLYLRGLSVGLFHMRARNDGIDRAIAEGPDALRAHLAEHYRDRDQVPILFWTAYVWGGAIQTSNADPEFVGQTPLVRALLERAAALDEGYFHAAPLMALAAMEAALPEDLGGNPEQSRAGFERVLEMTERRFFTVQLQYALSYAVSTSDRALFIRLLREIVDGGDPDPTVRLANRIARRKAIRLLRRTSEFFPI